MTAPITPFASILAQRERTPHGIRVFLGADWGQGRTMFGGMLSAVAAQAMRDVCGADWPLRALQTNFVGPVAEGAVDIEVSLLRQGKNIRQVQARIVQPDTTGVPQVAGVLIGVFGVGRTSVLPALRPPVPPIARTPEAATRWPYIPGMTPAFTQHFELLHAEGGVPFTSSTDTLSRTYVKLTDPGDVDPELHAILIADAGPTPALAMLPSMAPASSVSWALELRPVGSQDPQGLWRMDKEAIAHGEGYVNEKTTVWAPDGQLAALGYQVVAVYA